jgi:four helix bundle protein
MATSLGRVREAFPKTEMYGLTAQLRRAAVSVPFNIFEARGASRKTNLSTFWGRQGVHRWSGGGSGLLK